MKQKHIAAYMDVAHRFAKLSTAVRLNVGAIIVKDDRIISIGYNGTPSGWDNTCEYKHYCIARDLSGNYFPEDEKEFPFEDEIGIYKLVTKPEVIHAEANAIAKLAKHGDSADGSNMFVTHCPCLDCSKQIFTAGIKNVYYRSSYRSEDGINFLKHCGVKVYRVDEDGNI